MKFQKTLLAAALAASSAAAVAADDQANITRYKQAGNNVSLIQIDSFANGATAVGNLKVGQWYEAVTTEIEKNVDGKLVKELITEFKASNLSALPAGYTKEAAGMVKVTKTTLGEDTTQDKVEVVTDTESPYKANVEQNNYWSYGGKTTTTTTTSGSTAGYEVTLDGLLVNPDENGNTADFNGSIKGKIDYVAPGTFVGEPVTVIKETIKKDVHIGNLTEVDGTTSKGYTNYEFTLAGSNAQGTLATIKEVDAKSTAVAGVTGNGLAVLDVPVLADKNKVVVDLEKGTVTVSGLVGDVKTETGVAVISYKTADNKSVVSIGGEFYNVSPTVTNGTQQLTKFEGEKNTLIQDGYGLANVQTGGQYIDSVNTGLVSNKNVTYGEKVTVQNNEGRIDTSSTNANNATEHSGSKYIVEAASAVTTSKDVVTGIIAEDEAGNKTYGLQTTTVVDNKVTGQTTVTAEGITTTGTVNAAGFLINGESITSTVDNAVAGATKAIDTKIAEVDQRLTQFNTTANRLNKRIDEVEEVANRGVAIALAAQQQIPNIAAGQVAVFGGVGHYEGESAAALGLATVFADGRTSLSAAIGVAGGSEVGGRVGVAYVFGGK